MRSVLYFGDKRIGGILRLGAVYSLTMLSACLFCRSLLGAVLWAIIWTPVSGWLTCRAVRHLEKSERKNKICRMVRKKGTTMRGVVLNAQRVGLFTVKLTVMAQKDKDLKFLTDPMVTGIQDLESLEGIPCTIYSYKGKHLADNFGPVLKQERMDGFLSEDDLEDFEFDDEENE